VLRLGVVAGLANHTILLARDGRERPIDDCGSPIVDDRGEITGTVLVFRDITQRRQTDEALREAQMELAHVARLVTMGELVASIAHEVNQPLTGAVAHAGSCLRWLAKQPPDIEEAGQALKLVVRDGKRAGEVIGHIRALVKKVPPRRDRLEINRAILEVIALAHRELQKNDVELRTHLSSELPLVAAVLDVRPPGLSGLDFQHEVNNYGLEGGSCEAVDYKSTVVMDGFTFCCSI
jgi:signal transduction histidine kinase